jgi:glutathione S-transferase
MLHHEHKHHKEKRIEGFSEEVQEYVRSAVTPYLAALSQALKSHRGRWITSKFGVCDVYAFHALSLHLGLDANVLSEVCLSGCF